MDMAARPVPSFGNEFDSPSRASIPPLTFPMPTFGNDMDSSPERRMSIPRLSIALDTHDSDTESKRTHDSSNDVHQSPCLSTMFEQNFMFDTRPKTFSESSMSEPGTPRTPRLPTTPRLEGVLPMISESLERRNSAPQGSLMADLENEASVCTDAPASAGTASPLTTDDCLWEALTASQRPSLKNQQPAAALAASFRAECRAGGAASPEAHLRSPREDSPSSRGSQASYDWRGPGGDTTRLQQEAEAARCLVDALRAQVDALREQLEVRRLELKLERARRKEVDEENDKLREDLEKCRADNLRLTKDAQFCAGKGVAPQHSCSSSSGDDNSVVDLASSETPAGAAPSGASPSSKLTPRGRRASAPTPTSSKKGWKLAANTYAPKTVAAQQRKVNAGKLTQRMESLEVESAHRPTLKHAAAFAGEALLNIVGAAGNSIGTAIINSIAPDGRRSDDESDASDDPTAPRWGGERLSKNVSLARGGRTLSITGGGNASLYAFACTRLPPSAKIGYVFEVQINGVVESSDSHDSLAIGFTATPPRAWPNELPPTADMLQQSWLIGYNDGEMFDGNVAAADGTRGSWTHTQWKPSRLGIGDRVAVEVTFDGKFTACVNGDCVWSCDIAIARPTPPLYGIVDLLGRVTEVFLVD